MPSQFGGVPVDSTTPAAPTAGGSQFGGVPVGSPSDNGSPHPNVKPGASDDDIIKSFGFDPAVIKQSKGYQAGTKLYGSLSHLLSNPADHPYANHLGWLQDLGQGALDLVEGGHQLASHLMNKIGLMSTPDMQYLDMLGRLQRADYAQNIRAGNQSEPLRMAGNMIAGAVLPDAGALVPEGGGIVRSALRGAVSGGAAATVEPVDAAPGQEFAAAKAKQAGTGAALGGSVGAVAGAGKAFLSRLRAMADTPLPAQAAGAQATKLAAGMKETPWGSLDDVTEAAAKGDRHAQQVVDQIQNAGDNPGRVMQASINLQNYRSGQVASELYNRVGELADQNNLGNVPVDNALKALRQSENASKIGLKDPALTRSLKNIREAIAPKVTPATPTPPPSNIGDFAAWKQAQQPTVTPADTGYGSVRKVISQLDEMIRAKRTGDGALLSDRATGQLQQIKNALEDDVTGFVKNAKVPDLQAAQDTADQFYRTQRVPFKDVNLGRAATTDETDQIFQKFMQAGKGDRAQKFYDALDPKGQAAVQYQLVANGINKATDPVNGFDPGKFAQYMDKLKDSTGVFFQGTDRKALDGLTNLMVHDAQVNQNPGDFVTTSKLGRVLLNTPSAFTRDVPVLSKIPDTAQMGKWLLSTPQGQRYLYSASRMKPGSGAMRMLSAQIARAVTSPRGTALSAMPQEAEQQNQTTVTAQR